MNVVHLLIAAAIFEAVFLVFSLVYLPAIARAMRLSPYWRQPEPWTLWLELIPGFNLLWQFRNVRVAKRTFDKLDPFAFDLDKTGSSLEDLDEDDDWGDDEDFDEEDDSDEDDLADEEATPHPRELQAARPPQLSTKPDKSESDQTRPHAYLWLAAWARLLSLALLAPTVYALPRFWAHEGSMHDPWAIPLAIFAIVVFFALWQRTRYARQIGRLAKGASAEDVALAVVESHDPARCSCMVKINTDPQRVTEGVLTWAKDLRWHHVKGADCPLTFRLYGRFYSFATRGHKGITIEVHVPPEGWNISVRFVAYWDSWGMFHSAYIPQLSRALMAFTRGVCSEFGRRGVTVDPHGLGRPGQERDRLRRLTTLRWGSEVVFFTLGVLCIPGTVLVGMWREANALAPFGGLWLCAGFLFVADYLRRRVAGIKGLLSLLTAVFFLLMGLLLLLIGIFPPTE